MACNVGSIYASAVLKQVVIKSQRIRQVAPHCLILLSYTMPANCASGVSATMTCGALSLVGGLQRAAYKPGAKSAVYGYLVVVRLHSKPSELQLGCLIL